MLGTYNLYWIGVWGGGGGVDGYSIICVSLNLVWSYRQCIFHLKED